MSTETVKVTGVVHWTESYFSFKTTRPPGFKFKAGQFTMIGLMVDGKPLLRAYSMCSSPWDEELEFYSIKVQDGPLTSRLQHLKVGDDLLLGLKPVGTLIIDSLIKTKRLFLISTGTGVAPFMSVVRDYETYDKFDVVILVQTCRGKADLAYAHHSVEEVFKNEYLADIVKDKLYFDWFTTREKTPKMGRITDLINQGRFIEKFIPGHDSVMICGSMAMNKDLKEIVESHGMVEGNSGQPGNYVLERAFVD